MKIFVSWSGAASHEMALLLREWLIRVLQYSDPFVSSKDISKGAQWLVTISEQLSETVEGIVCVTPTNVEASWLNYEAGALAKTTGQTAVRTVLLGLKPGDLPSGAPLSNFQHTDGLNQDEMWSLIESIHLRSAARDSAIERVRWAFDQAWPDLRKKLEAIDCKPSTAPAAPEKRDDQSLLKDVLQEIKSLSIAVAALSKPSQPSVTAEGGSTLRARTVDDFGRGNLVQEGSKVLHDNYGQGVVVKVEGDANLRVATVQFANGILTRVAVDYAPIKVLDS